MDYSKEILFRPLATHEWPGVYSGDPSYNEDLLPGAGFSR